MSAFTVALLCLAFFTLSSNSQSCTHGSVRLVGGSGPWEGNVQLCYNGVWGWVCDNSFDYSDAYVVCRQLGYSTSYTRYRCCSYYGWGNGTKWLDYLYCSGSESSLLSCSRAYSVGVTYCGYGEMAGVYCHNGGTCTNGDLRLSRYPYYYGRSEGRLEYCHNNQWGSVCNDYWGSSDTRVACYQLGYYRYSANYGYYGYGVGSIWLYNVHCSGSESTISACSKSCIGCHNCGHHEDIGIRCYSLDSSSCTNGDVRLWSAYNHPPNEGIIQICKSGTWYAMCYRTSCYAAKIVCQQLGFAGALTTRSNAGYYYGYYYYNDQYYYNCYSYHSSLSSCYYYYSYSCGNYNDAEGVVCVPGSQSGGTCTDGDFRLVNGTTANEGRIEYCSSGTWTAMCSMSSVTAALICQRLGYNHTHASYYSDERFGRNNVISNFNYLSCSSSYTNVSQCSVISKGSGCYVSTSTCSTEYSIRCYAPGQCKDGQSRLYNGTIEQEGLVEVCINGVWSGVCSYGWGSSDAFVFCNSLGYDGPYPSSYYYGSAYTYFGYSYGPIAWSYVSCNGWEKDLFACNKYNYYSCPSHYGVGVICKEACTNGDVRLHGGGFENEGTVEVCYYNLWGLVSDLGWTDGDARVVCNQLGYSGGIAMPVHGSKYGKPNKTIHFKDVTCAGHEHNLAECSKTILYFYYSGKLALPNTNVAGVDCIYDVPTLPPCIPKPSVTPGNCNNGTIRLATTTGSSTDNGRAEYCYNGIWTPFCKMDNKVASVICRQLGHTAYSWATIYANATFGVTTNYSLFDNITCSGMETSVSQCTLNESPNDCTPYCPSSNINLKCYNPGDCSGESIRIVDGIIENEGRVELCVDGVWGSICDDGWDATDAHIVCTQLGHPELKPVVYSNSYFGDGNYPIVYSNMGCGGWESNIASCKKDSFLNFNCTRDNIAGVLCGYDCNDGDVRLVGSSKSSEGTVEVCFENLWGLVSESGWTQEDGEVVCKQLGYPTEGTEVKYGSFYGTPEKTILVSSAQCTGTEEKLSECTLSTLSLEQGKAALQTTKVAGVKCPLHKNCVSPITTGISCTDTQLRLTGNNAQSGEGNLEYCYKGTWSPFCLLGANEATVACRQLGFTDADLVSVFADGRYGSISNVSQFQNFTCNPDRDSLSECTLLQDCQSTCKYAIGIRCITRSDCQDGDVRLVNGSIAQEGRVEVCYNNVWGSLCGDQFDKSDGFVVCRELGLGDSEPTVYTNSYFGDGSGPILYSNLGCRGYENTIVDCAKSTYGSFSCSRSNVAGVTCQDACTNGDVKLVGGSKSSQGTVEVCYSNFWGIIADTNWDDKNAQVVCRQLGIESSSAKAVLNSAYGKPNKTVQLSNMDCIGNETTLDSCKGERIAYDEGRNLYIHINAAGVDCYSTSNALGSSSNVERGGYIGAGILGAILAAAVLFIVVLVAVIFFQYKRSRFDSQVKMSTLHDTFGVSNPMTISDPDIGQDLR